MRKLILLCSIISLAYFGVAYGNEQTDSLVSLNSDSALLVDSDSITATISSVPDTDRSSSFISISGGDIDWIELIILIGFLGGGFVVFPLVIITMIRERLSVPSAEKQALIRSNAVLDEDERNFRASLVLGKIEEKLSSVEDEDGNDWLTITKGSQARFMKRGLDYINKELVPTDIELVKRTIEFNEVYTGRIKRIFTGSGWIITCSVLVGVLFYFSGGRGFSFFLIVHAAALLSYLLASRPTSYTFLKRLERSGGRGGCISGVMGSLLMGSGEKHYVSVNGGAWERDHESEAYSGIIWLIITFVVAMILGFLTGLLAIINFLMNFSTSMSLPFISGNSWYEKKIKE